MKDFAVGTERSNNNNKFGRLVEVDLGENAIGRSHYEQFYSVHSNYVSDLRRCA